TLIRSSSFPSCNQAALVLLGRVRSGGSASRTGPPLRLFVERRILPIPPTPGPGTLAIETGVDMGLPIGNGFPNHVDDLTVGRLPLAKRQLHAYLVVRAAGGLHGPDKLFRMDAAVLVVFGREGPMAALVHRR